ncbi:MAG: cytochrome c maturation protein CcmE [Gammaproteobacteria bacterium]|nr:cytochrome c maturation protein CcmE [Gammaproteobacteria bacterium]
MIKPKSKGRRGLKRKNRRLIFLSTAMAGLGLAAALVFLAFDENLVFFFTPSDLSERNFSQEQRLRVGGLVAEGSVIKSNEGMSVSFRVTDGGASLPVEFNGILPDLFREGQGVVAEGHLINRLFIADEVLAKHDENYMPREVAEKLRENGQWRGDKGVDTP